MYDSAIFIAIIGISAGAGIMTKTAIQKRYAPENSKARNSSSSNNVRQKRMRQASKAMSRIGELAPLATSDSDNLHNKILRAGLFLEPGVWRGIQLTSAAAGVLLGVGMLAQGADAGHILFAVLFAFLGTCGPNLMLNSLARDRRAKIASSMASTLELLSITVRSGYPLERGMRLISTTSQGPLADEFRQVDADMNLLGMSPERALRRMDDRCRVPSVTSFCTSLIQAAKQGTSISRVLDAQARTARNEHYAAMQERVNKLPAKLVAPIFAIMMLIIVIALVPPVYDTVLVFTGQAQNAGIDAASSLEFTS